MSTQDYYDEYLILDKNKKYCPLCGKQKPFYGLKVGYLQTCSTQCGRIIGEEKRIKSWKKTVESRTEQEREIIQNNVEQAMLDRYGTKWNFTRPEVQEKSHSEQAFKKAKQTCLEKYGVEHPLQSIEVKNEIDYDKLAKSVYASKKKNGTLNKSSQEDEVHEFLYSVFTEVKRHYKCTRYPFNCDFYIPEHDLFIECHFHWTHGGKQFDPSSEECMDQLNTWQERSKRSNYYKTAIKTWTIRDVKKLKYLKQLNHIIFYSYKEFVRWKEDFNATDIV